jgi:hypothetical protein
MAASVSWSRLGKFLFTLATTASLLRPMVVAQSTPTQRGLISSRFTGPLWSLGAPGGGSASIAEDHLLLKVPGGSNHDSATSTNRTVRLVQPIADVNFDVAIKVDSPSGTAETETSQGLMVLVDDHDFLALALCNEGSKAVVKAHSVTGGMNTPLLEGVAVEPGQDPFYLRLRRQGSAYTALFSVNGNAWTEAGTFSYTGGPAWVGPFAGNFNQNPAEAAPVVMSVDWFNVLQRRVAFPILH